jgi:hypothetical protein
MKSPAISTLVSVWLCVWVFLKLVSVVIVSLRIICIKKYKQIYKMPKIGSSLSSKIKKI